MQVLSPGVVAIISKIVRVCKSTIRYEPARKKLSIKLDKNIEGANEMIRK